MANRAIEQLQEKYPGLRITLLMDQGDYIQMTVSSVLSNLAWGGVLAVIVAIRTVLSFTLELEVSGRWPWQRASAPDGEGHKA